MANMKSKLFQAALAAGLYAAGSDAASCSKVLVPTYNLPTVASGWTAQLVANGLLKPRSIQFDSAGGLLVVESGKGVSRLAFTDNGGTCLEVANYTTVVSETDLNHGLALSNDGKVLYASSAEAVKAWAYNAQNGAVSGNPATVVNGMSNNDLTTRTLLMSKKQDGLLLVSRGSSGDFDVDALDVSSGLSQIKAFDLTQASSLPYSYDSTGRRLGWGLRNSVGVAEHPITGGVYSVENSIDDVTRDGVDIHQNNPGEELNFHGFLNSSTEDQGGNYGYPSCFALWDPSIPDNSSLAVGSQFSMNQNNTLNDTTCADDYVSPRLTFQAHMAPLDLKFTADGASAFVTFHGSTDKTNPVGYKVSTIAFDSASGSPVAAADSTNALLDIIANPDLTKCPGACFRPVGLAFDTTGRLFVASDATGEIYVLTKASGSPTTTASGTIVTATGAPNAAAGRWSTSSAGLAYGLAAAVAFLAVAL